MKRHVGRSATPRAAPCSPGVVLVLLALVLSSCVVSAFELPKRRAKKDTADAARSADKPDTPTGATATSKVVTLRLEHSLGPDGGWTPRQTLTFASSEAKTSVFASESTKSRSAGKLSDNTLSDAEWSELQRLAASTTGLYHVRVTTDAGETLHASVPACSLMASGWRDRLHLHFTSTGVLYGFSIAAPITTCDAAAPPAARPTPGLRSKAFFHYGDEAAKVYVEPAEAVQQRKAVEQNSGGIVGLMRRYWYIVAAVVLFMLMGALPAPDEEQMAAMQAQARRR